MGAVERITVTIPAEMSTTLREQAETGDYASAGEIVREAIADWLRAHGEGDNDLIRAIAVGIDSGPGLSADDVFAALRSRYTRD